MLIREIAIFAILLFSLCRDASLIRPRLRCAKPTLPVLREIMRSGLPSLLRQGTTSLSAVLLSRICAGFGAHALSGMGLAVRVCTLYSSALIGFGQGFQPSAASISARANSTAVKPPIFSVREPPLA